MTMGDRIRSRAIKGGGKKKPSQIALIYNHVKIKVIPPLPKKSDMSNIQGFAPISDKDNECIMQATAMLEAVKQAKEEHWKCWEAELVEK